MKRIRGYIFDLDGVIVDTAKYHYEAWRRLANQLGFDISLEQNENLKGVSRKESLEYILRLGGQTISSEEQARMAELKNSWYVESINHMDASELLEGAIDLLQELKAQDMRIALGSASKNSRRILTATNTIQYFDAIIDGLVTTESKPHPQVFLMGAEALSLPPSQCVVFEDSINGIKAANTGGFLSIGVGAEDTLYEADSVIAGLHDTSIDHIESIAKNVLTI